MDWAGEQKAGPYLQLNILEKWASKDLQSANAYFARMTESPSKERLGRDFVGKIASRHDFDTAISWMENYLPETSHQQARGDALQVLVKEDPEQALTLAVSWDADPEGLIYHWAKEDVTAALTWAGGQGDLKTAERLIQNGIRAWSSDDPPAAAAYVGQLLASGQPISQDTITNLGHQWARTDPEALATRALALPEVSQTHGPLNAAIRELSRMNPERAAEILQVAPIDRVGKQNIHRVSQALREGVSEARASLWEASMEARQNP